MKAILLLLTGVLSFAVSLSQSLDDGRALFDKSDKRLNDAYQMLLAAKRSDVMFIRNLKASQRAWIQWRDAEYTLRFPSHKSLTRKDTLPLDQANFLARFTEERTQKLVEWLKNVTGGLVDYRYSDKGWYENTERGGFAEEFYVSGMKMIASGQVHGGVGLDKPYWSDRIIICGKDYRKGVVVHPEDRGVTAWVEFQLPKPGGRLLGVAGYGEEPGETHRGKMRFRIFGDGEFLYGKELRDTECVGLNVDLRFAKILRIETDDGGDGNISDHMSFGDLRVAY